MIKIIAVLNQKGGCGKTTLVINLARLLPGCVALVDTDTNSCSQAPAWEPYWMQSSALLRIRRFFEAGKTLAVTLRVVCVSTGLMITFLKT